MKTKTLGGFVWLIYPLLLLFLPNEYSRIIDIPIETWFLFIYVAFFSYFIGSKVFVLAIREKIWLAVLFLIILISIIKQDYYNSARVISWLLVLAITYYASTAAIFNKYISKIYLIFSISSILYVAIYKISFDDGLVNIFAWDHRTGYAYALVAPALYSYKSIISSSGIRKILNILFILVVMFVIFKTQARGAWFAFLIGLFAVTYFEAKNKGQLIRLAKPLMLGLVVVLFLLVLPGVSDRIISLANTGGGDSVGYRIDVHASAFRYIPESPLFEISNESYYWKLYEYSDEKYDSYLYEKVAIDSDIVWVLLEYGLISMILLVAAYLGTIFNFVRKIANTKTNEIYFGFFVFPVFIVQVILDSTLSNSYGWFQLGLILGALRATNNEK